MYDIQICIKYLDPYRIILILQRTRMTNFNEEILVTEYIQNLHLKQRQMNRIYFQAADFITWKYFKYTKEVKSGMSMVIAY